MKKTAVVLFNLGGPDGLKAIEPFLFNLFKDPAIIDLPNPLRWLVAKLISKKRLKEATEIYQNLGGKSPILEQTELQIKALEKELNSEKTNDYKVFIAMRYWNPRAKKTIQNVKKYNPDNVVLLPLYPQYSTTTSASSLKEWQEHLGNLYPIKAICCYPQIEGFTKPIAEETVRAIEKAKKYGTPRVLFTAHGLPKKIIEKGDPYKFQVDKTIKAIKEHIGTDHDYESVSCYQSRVGPLEWIKPYTDEEIKKAGQGRIPLVVVPIAFVSEHSETLVELDIEYKELAEKSGVPFYARVSTVQDNPLFIKGLKRLVEDEVRPCEGCSENNKCCFKNTLEQTKLFSTLTKR